MHPAFDKCNRARTYNGKHVANFFFLFFTISSVLFTLGNFIMVQSLPPLLNNYLYPFSAFATYPNNKGQNILPPPEAQIYIPPHKKPANMPVSPTKKALSESVYKILQLARNPWTYIAAPALITTGVYVWKKINKKQVSKQNTPDYQTSMIGTAAGFSAFYVIINCAQKIQNRISEKIKQMSFSADKAPLFNQITDTALQASGMDKLGVTIKHITSDIINSPQQKLNNRQKKALSHILDYKNSLFNGKQNTIIIPPKKSDMMPLLTYHEIGHAINYNTSKFWKFTQNLRILNLLSISIMCFALCKHKNAEGEKPTGTFDKAANFIKNNAGILSFATFIPTLAEECKATINGNNLAKRLLPNELLLKVRNCNKTAFFSYITTAIATGSGIFAAGKIKDTIEKC